MTKFLKILKTFDFNRLLKSIKITLPRAFAHDEKV